MLDTTQVVSLGRPYTHEELRVQFGISNNLRRTVRDGRKVSGDELVELLEALGSVQPVGKMRFLKCLKEGDLLDAYYRQAHDGRSLFPMGDGLEMYWIRAEEENNPDVK